MKNLYVFQTKINLDSKNFEKEKLLESFSFNLKKYQVIYIEQDFWEYDNSVLICWDCNEDKGRKFSFENTSVDALKDWNRINYFIPLLSCQIWTVGNLKDFIKIKLERIKKSNEKRKEKNNKKETENKKEIVLFEGYVYFVNDENKEKDNKEKNNKVIMNYMEVENKYLEIIKEFVKKNLE